MPFDPSKPFELVGESSGFDPTQSFEVVGDSAPEEKKQDRNIFSIDDLAKRGVLSPHFVRTDDGYVRDETHTKYQPGEEVEIWFGQGVSTPAMAVVEEDGKSLRLVGSEASDPAQAALVSAGLSAPSAAAFLATTGALAPVAAALPGAGKLAQLGKFALPLVGGMGAAALERFGQTKVLEKVAPDLAEIESQLAQQNPKATMAGAALTSGFRIAPPSGSLARELTTRAFPAGLGAATEAGFEAAQGNLGEEGSLERIAMAALTNAALNDPTKLGNRIMNAGARASGSITAQLSKAKTKNTPLEANASANEIATFKPEPDPNFSVPLADPLTGTAGPEFAARNRLARMPELADVAPGSPEANAGEGLGYFPETPRRKPELRELIDETYIQPREYKKPSLAKEAINEGIGVAEDPLVIEARAFQAGVKAARDAEVQNKMVEEAAIAERRAAEMQDALAFESGREEAASAGKKKVERFVGFQEDGNGGGFELWDAPEDIVGPNGRVLHTEGSTLSRQTLEGYGYKVPEAPKQDPAFDPIAAGARPIETDFKAREPQMATKTLPAPEKAVKAAETPAAAIPAQAPEPQFPLAPAEPDSPAPYVDKLGRFVKLENKKWVLAGGEGQAAKPTPGMEASEKPAKQDIVPLELRPPEQGSILDPRPAFDAAARGVRKVADAISAPEKPVSTSVWDQLTQQPENAVQKPSPEGVSVRQAPGDSQAVVGEVSKPLPEAKLRKETEEINRLVRKHTLKKPQTAEEIYADLKRESERNATEEPPESVAKSISEAPDQYRPFLTDLASRFPTLAKVPGAQSVSDMIGTMARAAKVAIGVLETNIKDHSPRIFGALRQKTEQTNAVRIALNDQADELGRLARKYLTREQFNQLDAANLSGDRLRAEAIINTSPKAKEIMAAYDQHQNAMKIARELSIEAGRDVGEVENYFPRRLTDRKGLLKAMGKETSTYDDMLNAARKEKGRELTDEEKDNILNSLVAGSMRNAGKPGYLKPRTIETISDNILRFYEPFDVATHEYISRVTRDVSNRRFFGKIDGDADPAWFAGDGAESSIGKLIREEIQNGTLTREGQDIVIRNLQDYFRNSTRYDADMAGLANKARRVQTYAYLADVSSAAIQFADIFTSLYKYGPMATAKGYASTIGKGGVKLKDIKIDEGNTPEIMDFRRASRPSGSIPGKILNYTGKAYDKSLRTFLGFADQFNKGALATSAYKWVQKVVNDPKSIEFQRLEEQYSKAFPERWPEILKSLKSKEFAQGKLDENSAFFLYNEVANLQPIDASGRAQGYNRASPLVKVLYTLRSYAIKQLDIIRRDIYNNIKKGGDDRWKGFGNLTSYLLLVGIGQQVFQYGRDKLLKRDVPADEYAITGLMQLALIPRYAIFRAKQEGPALAALETAIPGMGLARDAWKDVQTLNRWRVGQRDADGNPTVKGTEDALKQLEFIQYLPGFGREIYWWMGKGSEKEAKRAREKAEGKTQQSTIEMIGDIISPPDLKSRE